MEINFEWASCVNFSRKGTWSDIFCNQPLENRWLFKRKYCCCQNKSIFRENIHIPETAKAMTLAQERVIYTWSFFLMEKKWVGEGGGREREFAKGSWSNGHSCPLQPFDHLLTCCKVANLVWPLPNHKLIKVNEFLRRAGLPGASHYVIRVALPRMTLWNVRCLTQVNLLLGLFSRLNQQFRKSISLLNNQTSRC